MIEGHSRTHNEIKVSRFDRGSLVRLIQNGSKSPVVPQVEYVARYCETLGAKTVVVEERYVDRHYLDEFAFSTRGIWLRPRVSSDAFMYSAGALVRMTWRDGWRNWRVGQTGTHPRATSRAPTLASSASGHWIPCRSAERSCGA
jgi:hypothetical protein